jgi:hypothetical protein
MPVTDVVPRPACSLSRPARGLATGESRDFTGAPGKWSGWPIVKSQVSPPNPVYYLDVLSCLNRAELVSAGDGYGFI